MDTLDSLNIECDRHQSPIGGADLAFFESWLKKGKEDQ